jgi:predicted nucleotidyltransferase
VVVNDTSKQAEQCMTKTDNLTAKIKTIVTDASDVAIAFLFGSAINNRLRFDSDIDIAVAGYKVFSPNRMEELTFQFSESINRPIDLIDLLSTKGLVFHQALTTGIPVIVKDKRIMARLMNECVYFGDDFLPSITRMLEQKCRRFANA